VSQTTMAPDLLQTLQIFTKLAVQSVGENLTILSIDDVALTIEEPRRNLVLSG